MVVGAGLNVAKNAVKVLTNGMRYTPSNLVFSAYHSGTIVVLDGLRVHESGLLYMESVSHDIVYETKSPVQSHILVFTNMEFSLQILLPTFAGGRPILPQEQ